MDVGMGIKNQNSIKIINGDEELKSHQNQIHCLSLVDWELLK